MPSLTVDGDDADVRSRIYADDTPRCHDVADVMLRYAMRLREAVLNASEW